MDIIEEWKPVSGYEGLYEVSNLGRVKTLAHGKGSNNHYKTGTLTKKGYLLVQFWKGNQRKGLYIHRIVANAFLPNPQNLPQVNHKDGDKTNNKVDNLEWCTNSENQIHAVDTRLRKDSKMVRCIETGEEFTSILQCAKHLHVSATSVSAFLNKKKIYKPNGKGYILKRVGDYHFEYINENK